MANRLENHVPPDLTSFYRKEQLRRAASTFETTLESLDLEEERDVAEALIVAIKATEKAYEHETDRKLPLNGK